jgi:hypothetical protein
MILKHLRKVRANPQFMNSTIVFCPEDNFGGGEPAARMNDTVLDAISNVIIYKGEKGDRNGFNTQNYTKIEGARLALKALRKNSCFVYPKLMSGMENTLGDEKKMKEVKEKLRMHIQRLKCIQKTNQQGKVVTIISGKYGDDGKINPNNKDDLGIMYISHHLIYDIISTDRAAEIDRRIFE